MAQYVAVDGTVFTDDDLENWAREAEDGFPGARFGSSSPGRPVSVGHDARPVTVRLDADRRLKLDQVARGRHTTVSQVLRDLIDAL